MQQPSHGCTACVPLPAAAQKLQLLTAAGHDRGLYYWTTAAMEWEPQIEALWHMLGGPRLTNADKRKALTVGGAFFTCRRTEATVAYCCGARPRSILLDPPYPTLFFSFYFTTP